MVQTFLGRILPVRRDHRPFFYLAPAQAACDRGGSSDFPATGDRHHGQLLLFQSANHRALFVADRRRGVLCGPAPVARRQAH